MAKLGDRQHLVEAVQAYKKALKFREDSASRENLERVEKALQRENEDTSASQQPASAALSYSKNSSAVSSESNGSNRDERAGSLMQERSNNRGMSDREADKWLKMLAAQQSVQKYKIEVDDPEEGADNEKPW